MTAAVTVHPGASRPPMALKASASFASGYFAEFMADFTAGVFSPKITHSRASTATYIDRDGILRTAAANVPRITHDPATLQCRGYLHEAQTTNLALRSQEFDHSAWVYATGNVTVTPDAAIAPDGTSTADAAAYEDFNSYRYQGVDTGAAISGTTWTFSVWLWAPTKTAIGLRIVSDSSGSDETYTTVALTPTPTRFSVTRAFVSAGNGFAIGIDNRPGQGGDNVAGTVYVWGAQVEQNPAATSYIPTTSAAVVRAADIAYIDVATHLAGLSQTDSTFYAEFQPAFNRVFDRVIGTDSAGAESPIYMTGAGAIYLVGAFDGATELLTPNEATTARNKAAASFRSGARTVALDGQASTAATNASGAWTRIYLGSDQGIASLFTGLYREVKVWKRGFSAAETEAITE